MTAQAIEQPDTKSFLRGAIDALKSGADRAEVRKSAKAALKAKQAAEVDALVDAALLDAESLAQLEAAEQAASEKAAAEEHARRTKLGMSKRKLKAACAKFDAALVAANESFEEVEQALSDIANLSKGKRADVTSRRWIIVAAVWKNAKTFGARLGAPRSPGGISKWQTVSDSLRPYYETEK